MALPQRPQHSLAALSWMPVPCTVAPISRQVFEAGMSPESVNEFKQLGKMWDMDDYVADIMDDKESIVSSLQAMMGEEILTVKPPAIAQRNPVRKQVIDQILSSFRQNRNPQVRSLSYDLEITVRSVRPMIRRVVRVPASMTLHAFADRVLIVAFGYSRGEHTYIFTVPADGYPNGLKPNEDLDVVFGDDKAQTVDVMHLQFNLRGGERLISARHCILADLLRAEGDWLYFTYDLGDRLEHTVKLVKIHENGPLVDEKNRYVVLLEGQRAGIPENPGSTLEFAQALKEVFLCPPGHGQHRRLIADWAQQSNWPYVCAANKKDYDPIYFDAALCQQRLDKAVMELGGGEYRTVVSTVLGTGESCVHEQGNSQLIRRCQVCRKAPPAVTLFICSGCREVPYCSVKCQRKHWMDEHKYMCIKVPTKPKSDAVKYCAVCEVELAKVLRCSRCHARNYCGTACQRADWATHSQSCIVSDASQGGG